MPLGAISALILREGVVNGFRVAAAAAAGVASVDLIYCIVATTAGALLAERVDEHRGVFLILSGVVVVAIGLRQLRRSLTHSGDAAAHVEQVSALSAYVRFVGLTAINPLTLVYFVALGGVVTERGDSWVAPIVFVAAVGLSSLGWQLALASVGAFFGGATGGRARRVIDVTASVLILALGAAVAASGVWQVATG